MNAHSASAMVFWVASVAHAETVLGYWQDTAEPSAWVEYADSQLIEWLDGRRMSASPITLKQIDGQADAYAVRYADDPATVERLSLHDGAHWQLERQLGTHVNRLRRLYSSSDLHSGKTVQLRQVEPWKSGGCSTVMTGFGYRPSSTLEASSSADYEAIRMLDGRADTAWVEAARGTGVGEWLTLELSALQQQLVNDDHGESGQLNGAEAMVLEGLQITNGYPKTERLYQANGRVALMRVELDGAWVGRWSLTDTDQPQAVAIEPPLLLMRDSRLRLQISAVYPGSRYADTAIAELQPVVHGCAQILAID